MSTFKKIAFPAALAVLFVPFVRFQGRFEVEVNWSFREATPTAHTVTIQDLTFTVPSGQSVKQVIRLKGGGSRALVYTIRDWGFLGQRLKVDGKEISGYRMRRTHETGTIRILGMGRSPSMDVEIEM